MKFYFLVADTPLTKQFTALKNGDIEKTAYPNVLEFTSLEAEISDTAELHSRLCTHASMGHCLVKGRLNKQLVSESRAGSTNSSDPSSWIVFDVDGANVSSVEDFVQTVLPAEFRAASYVVQWSASQGIVPAAGLRFHLFFLLDQEYLPEQAKSFLTELNLTVPVLSDALELTASGVSLRYTVDRTVVQNDKLIYIAPPTCVNITDPLAGARIEHVVKTTDTVNFRFNNINPARVDQLNKDKINELRKLHNLKPRTTRDTFVENVGFVCSNPERAVVSGERRGRGFVYLNLNGGDSFAYYYPEKNPKYLFNFKGEPVYLLSEICPEYWEQVKAEQFKSALQNVGLQAGQPRPFAFRNQPTDTFWNGVYDEESDRLVALAPTSGGKKINDFYVQYGFAPPKHIEDWTFEFQPWNNTVIDFTAKFCNRFERSKYMRMDPVPAYSVPSTISTIISSVLGNSPECIDHFMNWLAWIFQNRAKTGTAWVMHGVEGTGKGLLYSRILMPLFGEKYCVIKQLRDLDDKFNAELEQNLFFVLDEAKMSSQVNAAKTVNQLKSLITEPFLSVRAMRANAVQVRSYSNFLFFSNDYDALAISETDRRFNVAPRQEKKLRIAPPDIERIDDELEQFAQYLMAYPADEARAKTALDNDAKRLMRLASQDAFEQLCQAMLDGNLEYFMLFMTAEVPVMQDVARFAAYKTTMRQWLDSANQTSFVTADQIDAAFAYLIPSDRRAPQNMQKRLSYKNIQLQTRNHIHRGLETQWKVTDEQMIAWKPLFASSIADAAPPLRAVI